MFAPIDRIVRISLRQEALEVSPQDIITRNNVTLKVNSVIFLRVIDPRLAVVEVSNYLHQTSQFAQTTPQPRPPLETVSEVQGYGVIQAGSHRT